MRTLFLLLLLFPSLLIADDRSAKLLESLINSGNLAASRFSLWGHKQRLETDIAELKKKREIYPDHIWLPESIDTTIRLKEDALYYVRTAQEKITAAFANGETIPRLHDPKDAQEYCGSQPEESEFGRENSGLSSFLMSRSRLAETITSKIPIGPRNHGEHYLESIGAYAATGMPLEERKRFLGLPPEMRRALRHLAHPYQENPYLSTALKKAEALAQALSTRLPEDYQERIHLTNLTEALSTIALQEIYESPETLSPSWLRNEEIDRGSLLNDEEKQKQLAHQSTLVSPEDKRLSKEERLSRWHRAKAKLLAIYHSPAYQAQRFTEHHNFSSTFEDTSRIVDGLSKAMRKEKPETLPPSIDLSAQFQKPRSQGQTHACVGFAIVSDMETFGTPLLSPLLAYSLMLATEWLNTSALPNNPKQALLENAELKLHEQNFYKKIDSGVSFYSIGILEKYKIAPEEDFSFVEAGWMPEDLSGIQNRNYSLKNYFRQYGSISELGLKQMLAAGIAPVVSIKYDGRTIREDWIRPEPVSPLAHAINVVGYGQAFDPFDLQYKTYFLIRDSFTPQPIHYRVSSEELIPLIQTVIKVIEVNQEG